MSIIEKISQAIDSVGNAVDKNITSKEEVLVILKELKTEALQAEKETILQEMKGSSLQRNWRPIMMYMFTYIIFHSLLIAPILESFWGIPKADIPMDKIWDILQISISGYVIGRTGEKILPKATDVAKKVLVSRKERKAAKKNERES